MNVFRLGLILALFTVGWAPAQAQNQVWIDIVPMTRQLLGADDATDLALAAGWGTDAAQDGWRGLIGFNFGQETQDNFGTTITTLNQRVDLRVGRRWRSGEAESTGPVALFTGLDVVFGHDLLRTESQNLDFRSTNSTTVLESGLSGVLGIQCRLTPQLHLVTEVRMDAVYITETDRVSDNFSGEFKEVDHGWQARLTPPLQLMLVLGL